MTNDEALRQIVALQPEMRQTQAALRKARQEHPELFPPNVPPLFTEMEDHK